ncbi:YihY family inner membrane protein [Primorskyibacter sedentarius]|uniref:YihY family inner membrane protein n=1 Tax=Primorskyibacter sedentarius TaxID=745311 RepID=UPI003EBA2C87
MVNFIKEKIAAWRKSHRTAIPRNVGQFTSFAVRRFLSERLSASAAALTYSSLLALVPLLVIAFAILSSFPAFNVVKDRMQALFFQTVVPEAGAAIADYLTDFTGNASNLTSIGILALAVTAVFLLGTIEATLNQIWHVERPRPIFVRFLIFWAILTLGPLLIGASFVLTSDLVVYLNQADLPGFVSPANATRLSETWLFSKLVGLAISIIGFTALFVLVPARRVRIWHGVIGATIAAIAFEMLSWGFNAFLTSGSSYQTIYGAVAVVPVFLVWVYASWMVIIFGAVVAASIPDWLIARTNIPTEILHPSDRLVIAAALLARLYEQSQDGGTLSEDDLVEAAPIEARDEIFEALHVAGYLMRSEDNRVALTRDLTTTTAFELASDLNLTLGLTPSEDSEIPNEIRERLMRRTAGLGKLLNGLSQAEAEILNRPLSQILTAKDDRKALEARL